MGLTLSIVRLAATWHFGGCGTGMQRREFITLLGGAAVWPLAVRAQQQPLPVIGFLNSASPDGYTPELNAFRQGLKETGYVEGQNVMIEYRWANGQFDRLAALADDLVRRRVLGHCRDQHSCQSRGKGLDHYDSHCLHHRRQPGPARPRPEPQPTRWQCHWRGSIDEGSCAETAGAGHELVPTATVFGLLINPKNPSSETGKRDLQAAAVALGLQLNVLYASTEAEIDEAFTTFRQMRAGALVIGTDVFFNSQIEQLAALAIRNSVIAIYAYHQFVAAGGLASYSASMTDVLPSGWRLCRTYSQRRETSRPSGTAGNESRTAHQPQDR